MKGLALVCLTSIVITAIRSCAQIETELLKAPPGTQLIFRALPPETDRAQEPKVLLPTEKNPSGEKL